MASLEELTRGRLHAKIADGTFEDDDGQSLKRPLVLWRLKHTVARCLEVATADDFLQGLALCLLRRLGGLTSVSPKFTTKDPGLYLTYLHFSSVPQI